MKNTGTKKLKTARLVLRKMRMSDYAAFHCWYCLEEVSRFSSDNRANTKRAAAKFLLRYRLHYFTPGKKDYYYWAITLAGRMIGFVGLNALKKDDQFSVYYMLSPAYQRNGYVKEAVAAVLEYMKTQRCRLIFGSCDSENIASYRVLSGCGFQWIKRIENHYHYSDGRSGDREAFVYRF